MIKNEYRKKVLAVNEDDSFSLPPQEWYDRIRFKREILAQEHLIRIGNTRVYPEHQKALESLNLELTE